MSSFILTTTLPLSLPHPLSHAVPWGLGWLSRFDQVGNGTWGLVGKIKRLEGLCHFLYRLAGIRSFFLGGGGGGEKESLSMRDFKHHRRYSKAFCKGQSDQHMYNILMINIYIYMRYSNECLHDILFQSLLMVLLEFIERWGGSICRPFLRVKMGKCTGESCQVWGWGRRGGGVYSSLVEWVRYGKVKEYKNKENINIGDYEKFQTIYKGRSLCQCVCAGHRFSIHWMQILLTSAKWLATTNETFSDFFLNFW